MLVGKVISGVPVESTNNLNIVCFTCCLADSDGECAALTIYNLAARNGVIIGDSVAIPEPWIERVNFSFSLSESLRNEALIARLRNDAELSVADEDKHEFKFESVRVENPTVLVVNGKKWTKEKLSSAFFIPKVIAD